MIEKLFIQKGLKRAEMEEFLRKELFRAGFTHADIVKTPMVTRIIVNVTRPGLAIGKSGQNIRQLTETVEKRFGVDNPQIEIRQIENPKLDAQVMVNEFKSAIDRGFSWRSYAYRMVHDIMEHGAQGVELIIKGKLSGKGGRKRKVRIAEGYMKKIGDQVKKVDYAQAAVYLKAGAIGIKLRIVKPGTLFPDKVNIMDYVDKVKTIEEEKEEQEEKGEEKTEVKKKDVEGKGKKEVKKEGKKEEKAKESEESKKEQKKKKEKPKVEKVEKKKEAKKAEGKKEKKKAM